MALDKQTLFEKRKFTLLLISLLTLILLPAARGSAEAGASAVLWGIVLIAAVHAAAGKPWVTLLFAGVALLGYSGRLAASFGWGATYEFQVTSGTYTFQALFLAMTTYVVFSAILRSDTIRFDTVMGALCVYLLIGFLWSNLYALTYLADPNAFNFPDYARPAPGAANPELAFGYYSFVTLTTLGYGDITPVAFRARTLSWLEAVVGVTYMATVIAFLVSQVIAGRQPGGDR